MAINRGLAWIMSSLFLIVLVSCGASKKIEKAHMQYLEHRIEALQRDRNMNRDCIEALEHPEQITVDKIVTRLDDSILTVWAWQQVAEDSIALERMVKHKKKKP